MSKSISPKKRALVFAKTAGACGYCGVALDPEMFPIDHVHPRFHGGTNHIDNLLPACHPCNGSKGKKDIESFRLYAAAKRVTGAAIFGQVQLDYLLKAGAFPALGFDENHLFHFERFQASVGSAI